MEFGGLGGIWGGRELDPEDLFEATLNRLFGEQLRAEGPGRGRGADATTYMLGERLWGSLANVDWHHKDGHMAGYSFRAAGDLIAAIVGRGDYLDWYCSYPYDGTADEWIAEVLAAEGWAWEPMKWEDAPFKHPHGEEPW